MSIIPKITNCATVDDDMNSTIIVDVAADTSAIIHVARVSTRRSTASDLAPHLGRISARSRRDLAWEEAELEEDRPEDHPTADAEHARSDRRDRHVRGVPAIQGRWLPAA